MGPLMDLRINSLDVGIPLLHTQTEVRADAHNSLLVEYCYKGKKNENDILNICDLTTNAMIE